MQIVARFGLIRCGTTSAGYGPSGGANRSENPLRKAIPKWVKPFLFSSLTSVAKELVCVCVLPKFAALLSEGLSIFGWTNVVCGQCHPWQPSVEGPGSGRSGPRERGVAVGSVTIGDRSVYILLSLTGGGEGRRGGVNLCKFPALGWP